MATLPQALKTLLADVFTMYLTAHGYHWNVEGPDFAQYHELFDKIVGDTYDSIDPTAENIRKLGDYAPFTMDELSRLATVRVGNVTTEPRAMARSLVGINDAVSATLATAIEAAFDANEQGIANFLADRIDMHAKWHWFLTASLK